MRFRSHDDGKTFDADSPQAVVEHLYNTAHFASEDTLESWMQASAWRAGELTGHPVRSTTAAQYVSDLIAAGLLSLE